jgi:hypothetical protein
MIRIPYQIEERMKKIKTRELQKKKKKKKKNQNFFTPKSVPATFSSRLCHHLHIIVKLFFLQTWVGGSEYEGSGSSPVLLDWRGLQLMAKMVLAKI